MNDMPHQMAPDDARHDDAVDAVLTDAFGPGRFAKVSERVREIAVLDRSLSRIALLDGAPVGCCRLYRIDVGGTPALFLGPLAVREDQQGATLGVSLVRAALEACDTHAQGVPIIVVGQPRFFRRFGFRETERDTIVLPGPVELRRLQWRAANGAAPRGVLSAPRAAS